jgi:hypothetical protein
MKMPANQGKRFYQFVAASELDLLGRAGFKTPNVRHVRKPAFRGRLSAGRSRAPRKLIAVVT